MLSESEDTNYLSDGRTFAEYLAKIGPPPTLPPAPRWPSVCFSVCFSVRFSGLLLRPASPTRTPTRTPTRPPARFPARLPAGPPSTPSLASPAFFPAGPPSASPSASPTASPVCSSLALRLLLRLLPRPAFPLALCLLPCSPSICGARCRRAPAADLAGGRARRLGRPSSVPDSPGDSSVWGLFCPKGPMVSARRAGLSAEGTRGRHAKVKNSVFCFYFLIKDVSLCSQNNTLSE